MISLTLNRPRLGLVLWYSEVRVTWRNPITGFRESFHYSLNQHVLRKSEITLSVLNLHPSKFPKVSPSRINGRPLTVRPELYANNIILKKTSQFYCVLAKALTLAGKRRVSKRR